LNGGGRLLPLFLVALFLAALAGALSNVAGPHAYPPRLLFLGSIVSFIGFLYRGRREIVFLFLKARRVSEPGPATTWILAGAVLLVASLVLSRLPVRYDTTSRGLNRLSRASQSVLASLDTPIEMIGVFRETSGQRDRAIDILEIYRNGSKRISTRMLDPDREPDEARRLELTQSGVIIVKAGSVKEAVPEMTEEAITQAILRVEYPRRSRIAFVTGHEERGIADMSPQGLGNFAVALRESGYMPVEVRLLDQDIPADAATLAIVGAQKPLLPGEITKIGEYLDHGGRLFLCLDPGNDIGLKDLLRGRGIVLDSLEVYDEGEATRSLGMGPHTIVVSQYPKHAIIPDALGYTVFSGVRRIGVSKDPIWGINEKVVLWTGRQARLVPLAGEGKSDGENRQMQSIGVSEDWEVPGTGVAPAGQAAPEKPYARLFAVGDSDWLSGQFIGLFSNREFAVRSIHWLTEREFLLKIPPIDLRGTPLRIGLSGIRTLFYFLELGLPLTLLGIGLWLWSRRR
jgi:hypothetical protein